MDCVLRHQKGIKNRFRTKKRGKKSKAARERERKKRMNNIQQRIQASECVVETQHKEFAKSGPSWSPEFPKPFLNDFKLSCFSSTPNENVISFTTQDSSDNEDLPPLAIQVEESIPAKSFPSNRVICDIEHVITQARKLEEHTSNCKFGGKMVLQKVVQKGLIFTYNYLCNKPCCKFTARITTDKEKSPLNQLTVLGALSTGNGYSLEEQKFSMMNMSKNTYISCEAIAGQVLHSCKEEPLDQ